MAKAVGVAGCLILCWLCEDREKVRSNPHLKAGKSLAHSAVARLCIFACWRPGHWRASTVCQEFFDVEPIDSVACAGSSGRALAADRTRTTHQLVDDDCGRIVDRSNRHQPGEMAGYQHMEGDPAGIGVRKISIAINCFRSSDSGFRGSAADTGTADRHRRVSAVDSAGAECCGNLPAEPLRYGRFRKVPQFFLGELCCI